MTTQTLGELAAMLQGELLGNPNVQVTGVLHPALAQSEQDMALVLDKAILPLLAQKTILTALVPADLDIPTIPNQIKVKRVKVALSKLLEVFERPAYVSSGIHPSAVVDPSAVIEADVAIGPLCSVGPNTRIGKGTRLIANISVGADVKIGDNCLFYAGVCIGDRVEIGNRVILQSNATIGNDGYSFVTQDVGSVESARSSGKIQAQNAAILRINSIGTVVLEDDVEVGANSCVDRATLGETRIKRGTKIDNLVQVAHNVTIGENCFIVGQAGIAGSSVIGDRTVIAGQVGIKDHATIGSDCIIMPQSGVTQDIPDRSIMVGSPAIPRKEFLHKEMQVKRLKSLHQKLDELMHRVEILEGQKMEQPV